MVNHLLYILHRRWWGNAMPKIEDMRAIVERVKDVINISKHFAAGIQQA